MDHKQIDYEVIKWIQLASDGFQQQVHVKMVKNLQTAHNVGTSSPAKKPSSPQERLCSMESVTNTDYMKFNTEVY
jgi:hypothetical protein